MILVKTSNGKKVQIEKSFEKYFKAYLILIQLFTPQKIHRNSQKVFYNESMVSIKKIDRKKQKIKNVIL